MPLPAKLQAQIDDLSFFSDRSERIQALIELGEEFVNPGPDIVARSAANRVPGCESEVYVTSEPYAAGRRYCFAVDNPQGISAMALARLLETNLDGVAPEEIARIPEDLIYDIFGRELSMGKSLGLIGMIRMVKIEAART